MVITSHALITLNTNQFAFSSNARARTTSATRTPSDATVTMIAVTGPTSRAAVSDFH